MLNFVLKAGLVAAASAMGSKLVHESYPAIKKEFISITDTVWDFCSFKAVTHQPQAITTGNKLEGLKQPQNALTYHQYISILDVWEANKQLPQKDRITQVDLTKKLNAALGLNYTRSGYCHLVFKRVIPIFKENNDG